MSRESLMRKIAELDAEINRELSNVELPSVETRRFPAGTWLIALGCLAWYYFGEELPIPPHYYADTATYLFYGGVVITFFAVLGTLAWIFRKRGGTSPEYREAVQKVRVLQDRRRDFQIQLKELEE